MSDSEEEGLDLFQEPEGFYKPEKEATFVSHKMLDGRELNLRLVGHNPLWVWIFLFLMLYFVFLSSCYAGFCPCSYSLLSLRSCRCVGSV